LRLESLGFGAPGTKGEVDQPRGHILVDGLMKPLGVGPGEDLANPILGPAGTIHISIADWATFAAAHLAGARGERGDLLRQESFSALHADYRDQGYGLGWGIASNPWGEGRALVHTGSCGAWTAVIWVLPEANAAIVAAANYGGAHNALSAAVDRVMRLPVDAAP
jgi:CubicO group peptidase (beta-lactamase class C family)